MGSVGSEWDSELGSLPPSPEDFSEEDDIHLMNGCTSAPLGEITSQLCFLDTYTISGQAGDPNSGSEEQTGYQHYNFRQTVLKKY